MKIKWHGFLGTNHSWAIVAQNISRELIHRGHDVELISTNGVEHLPDDLKPCLRNKAVGKYDVQLTYTALKNFPNYLADGSNNRFGIWNYETTVLPPGFAKAYRHCDLLLPSSEFSKKIFAENGVPESYMRVVPHGVNFAEINSADPYKLRTTKKVKFLANIAQPHYRKNIDGLLDAWGKAFTKADDVCLVLKVVNKEPTASFEQSFSLALKYFKAKYKNHADVEIITQFIPNIYGLYKSCDYIWTMSHAECFWMPGLEGMAAGAIPIAPRYGGQLDFMNDETGILIEGSEMRAPPRMQYWVVSSHAKAFNPSVDDAVEKLRACVSNLDEYKLKFVDKNKKIGQACGWDSVVDKIIGYIDNY